MHRPVRWAGDRVELLSALRRVRDEIGVATVRAHAILHDDLGVYREVDGEPVHDFTAHRHGLRPAPGDRACDPCVEIGFMPRDLASDPTRPSSPTAGSSRRRRTGTAGPTWSRALVAHLLERYGDEVLGWDFEVWNEANLEVFWSGTRDEWMQLYDVTARR